MLVMKRIMNILVLHANVQAHAMTRWVRKERLQQDLRRPVAKLQKLSTKC